MDCYVNIAIDGPAGAGKSTVAKLVAEKLGYVYVDTGAMYRVVTLQVLMDKKDVNDEANVTQTAKNVNISFKTDNYGKAIVFLNNIDVSHIIRTPEVSRNVSLVSRMPGVRKRITQLSRKMANENNVIMEGRDIGTQVLPDADMKFFLTASVEERARRRYTEMKERGFNVKYSEIINDIKQRDEIDSTRAVAPLKPALDAEIIDCSKMTVEQVVEFITVRVSGRLN